MRAGSLLLESLDELQATDRTNGQILWANLHLLFWLSLVPFTTAWLGENNFAATPAARSAPEWRHRS